MLPSTTNTFTEYTQLCKLDIAKGLDVGTSYVNCKGAALLMKTISNASKRPTDSNIEEIKFFMSKLHPDSGIPILMNWS
jgi:hypothetical protein